MNKKSQKVKFLLTPRPQKDPLAADYEAPPNVLVPQDGKESEKIRERFDDFDPQVFVSETQTKEGMLNRAHKPDGMLFDSDILKAMSQEFDYDDPNNCLDDDFFDQAGGLIEEDEGDFEEFDLAGLEDEMEAQEPEVVPILRGFLKPVLKKKPDDQSESMVVDELMNLRKKNNYDDDGGDDDDEDDRKTVFTNYSLTSSVMHRNQGLKDIDEHFERIYEKQYANDEEIASDEEGVKGHQILNNKEQIKQLRKEVTVARKRNHDDIYEPEIVSEHHKNAIIGDSDNEQDLVETEIVKRENRVDCESILTYNSTLYNHPRLIVEGGSRKRNRSKCSDVDMEELEESPNEKPPHSIASSRASILSRLSIRPPNETVEDKRSRKKALKMYRHERRQERKQNQSIFKKEQANLAKQEKNNRPGLRLV